MTTKEIQKFIKKALLGRINDNLMIKGPYLIKYPIADILSGFCFERSGFDKDSIYISWFVQPLFIPSPVIYLTFGGRLERKNRSQSWSNLNSEDTINELVTTIQNQAFSMNSLSKPKRFFDYYIDRPFRENIRIYEALIYTSIWIASSDSKKYLKDFVAYIDNNFDLSIGWIKKIRDEMINIEVSANPYALLQSNKENLIKHLGL